MGVTTVPMPIPKTVVLAVLGVLAVMRYGPRKFGVWIHPRRGLEVRL
jgi:hypothetical protein